MSWYSKAIYFMRRICTLTPVFEGTRVDELIMPRTETKTALSKLLRCCLNLKFRLSQLQKLLNMMNCLSTITMERLVLTGTMSTKSNKLPTQGYRRNVKTVRLNIPGKSLGRHQALVIINFSKIELKISDF
jgi:hypothetical protein